MNLREIRDQFILKSGRYDLVLENGQDNGANFFIQAGQRFLDKYGDFGTGNVALWLGTLKKGVTSLVVPNCWAVLQVWSQTQSGCWESVEVVNSIACDKCRLSSERFYSVEPLTSLPKIAGAKASDLQLSAKSLDLSTKSVDNTTGVKLNFWSNHTSDLVIKVKGHFYSDSLTSDTSTSYWTNFYPETLLKSAMYELEVFYRNTEGANDWLDAVMVDLQRLEQTQLFNSVQGDLVFGRDL